MNRFKSLPNNDVKQAYALYLAAAEAVAQGHQVRVCTGGNRYWLDVNGHMVQVRSSGSGSWQFGNWDNPLAEKTEFVVFADFSAAQDDRPAYYLVPADWFRQDVERDKHAYLAAHQGHRAVNDNSRHHQVRLERIEQWQNRWDLLA
jgi:hypothetical protein